VHRKKVVLSMPDERSSNAPAGPDVTERAIMLQVLRDDHEVRWSRAELEREIFDVEPIDIADAIEHLRQEGLLHILHGEVIASRAALHLDQLGMVTAPTGPDPALVAVLHRVRDRSG
jgi:hypothetical protein